MDELTEEEKWAWREDPNPDFDQLPSDTIKVVGNYHFMVIMRAFDASMFMQKCWHLIIVPRDKNEMDHWNDLQRIKNDLMGEDMEGFELYPQESRVLDSEDVYHMWVLPRGVKMPFELKGISKKTDLVI